MKLSSRQHAILDFIKREVKDKGYPPSVREIGEAVGLASSSTVHGHLARLEKKGLIRRDPTKPRAIEILDDLDLPEEDISVPTVRIPVVGKVTAGEPILAVENVEEYFVLPERMVGPDTIYMLKVEGNSMIEAGILDGDYVIVRQQSVANNGDIVVAMTEDEEATVKTFYKEKNHIRLQPENPDLEPILLPHVTILGKVVGVFRNLH
ncbi:transcriptional repressor LexA [Ammoniphilus sp. CFH 90114]|uniref:transcriptional repressor LexA n=1 Tax=Ammoniphilus sp. CFH 90114 TaxID=2493665 RepID=UPI00100ED736|nr:transcriptional repressor LexA [Ammoniphilus sp. CFH 90114]RXT04103.1 transcriptional repressor LexA [Ammoniphilus sp. CFH 90114]